MEERLQLIQNEIHAKRAAESSVHQSTSIVVADAEKRGPNSKKISESPSEAREV